MPAMCIATTKQGVPCSRRYSTDHGNDVMLCGTHTRQYCIPIAYQQRMRTSMEMMVAIREDEVIFVGKRLRKERREAVRMHYADVQQDIQLVDEIVDDAFQRRLDDINNAVAMIDRPEPQPRPKKQDGELKKFVNDKQNIHTSAAVQQTINILNTILKIKVPSGYKWNMKRCSKTPGEVIAACRLSIDSARTMMDKYTTSDDIYEMGYGIYGRVLDCVWQYIKNSEDNKTLCKILKTEMEDNIGMCQQGNLSRLANVLAGYLEGVGSGESIAEVLGREFPKLLDIDDEDKRLEAGNKILDRLAVVDKDTRKAWIDGLY